MRRLLLAGCLATALASSGSTQSPVSSDDALSPMEILSSLSKQPAAPATPATQASPGKAAGTKTDAAKKADAAKKPDASKSADHETDYLGQCLRDWDAATHMTRQEWARTCRRVAASRTRYLREYQGK